MSDWQIAFETSGRNASVAMLRQDNPIVQTVLDPQKRTAEALGPAVADLIAKSRREGTSIGFVSVSAGPGSFTGLRIGVTAAKTLAYGLGCPVVTCDTLAVILSQIRRSIEDTDQADTLALDAAMNAYRGQVFWRRESISGEILVHSNAIDAPEWQATLTTDNLICGGDAWDRYGSMRPDTHLAARSTWQPRAAEVGWLAWRLWRRGLASDPFGVIPNYLRESAAVEKKKG
jgi:tRNA threonylcarbamoyladenosine biosynthesis protein TsaB